VDEDQAKRVASEFLAERFEEFRSGEWVVTRADEYDAAWSVGYQVRLFTESGRIVDSLAGNGPVVVPKSGEQPWVAWSGRPVEEQIAEGRPTLG
jgi:hypothetical protein